MRIDCKLEPFVPEMLLFHKRKKCEEWCKKNFGSVPEFKDSDAQTILWNGVGIVLMEITDEPIWEYALLTHEAYHIVMQNLRNLGEEDAGEEIVAYMVQLAAGSLMAAHEKWRKKHASKKRQ